MTESGLLSAGGPLPLTQAVPGNISTGPCGPGGAPYGAAGRSTDGPDGRADPDGLPRPGDAKGLKP